MKASVRWVVVTAAVGVACLAFAGCDHAVAAKPVNVDAPQLASALRWVGSCAVLCSALGAAALIIASRKRRK